MQPRGGGRVQTAVPAPPVRTLPLLALLALAAGCADPAPEAASTADPEAARLLEAIDRDALADAFARLDRTPHRARLVVTSTDEAGAETRETADDDGTRFRDPVAAALTEDPPYLDPAAREAYRLAVLGDTTIGRTRFRIVEAALVDPASELGVRRVWAAVTEAGTVGAVEVDRQAASALFGERSRVRVDLAPHGDGWLPRRAVTHTWTDVPLSAPARVRTEWTVDVDA